MVELLAPAGNREAFSAALEAGTDAIYLGGQQFGARQYANNFTADELSDCIRLAHILGVRVYVTVNTLVDDSEIPALKDYLRYLYEAGADAAIVQDLGVARLARRVVPLLPIHASTQMTVHDLAGVNQLADYGFERVILSRELSLAEIGYICQRARCKVETFVHGALCICYSGQCLMSSMIGGRSGNRGRCAQPCRLPYQLTDSHGKNVLSDREVGEYLLSPKDFRTIEHVPELIRAGIASLKIEGRMKRPEYVAVVVDAYRRAIDRSILDPEDFSVPESDLRDLEQIFNRGFTSAHLFEKNGREMMSDRRPNNRGVMIGRVTQYSPQQRLLFLKLEGPLAPGDILEAWVKVGGRVSVEVESLQVNGLPVDAAEAGEEVSLYCPEFIRAGDRVFKVYDSRLTRKVQSWYAKPYARRRIPVSMTVHAAVGKALSVEIFDGDGNRGVAQTQFIGQAARNRPLTKILLETQCARLGSTAFGIDQFDAVIEGEVMVPVSEINDARRRAVEELEILRLNKFNRPSLTEVSRIEPEFRFSNQSVAVENKNKAKIDLLVKVDTVEQVEAALSGGADWLMISGERFHRTSMQQSDYEQVLSRVNNQQKRIIFNLPRIIRDSNANQAEQQLAWFAELEPDAVGVANIGSLAKMSQYPKLKIHADYPLNLFNSEALSFVREMGAISATLSPELTLLQVQKLVQSDILPLECLVHGQLTLMISELCVLNSYLGKCSAATCDKICRQDEFRLQDRKGEFFPVMTDEACRMHIINGKELSMLPHVPRLGQAGIKRIRIEACRMKPEEVCRITGFYRRAIDAGAAGLPPLDIEAAEHADITRGHYFRGVL